jgi:hypothetical protein
MRVLSTRNILGTQKNYLYVLGTLFQVAGSDIGQEPNKVEHLFHFLRSRVDHHNFIPGERLFFLIIASNPGVVQCLINSIPVTGVYFQQLL